MSELLIFNIGELVTAEGGSALPPSRVRLKVFKDAGIFIKNGRISDIGPSGDLIKKYGSSFSIDVDGMVVVPGFVDPHTHLIYAGCRHDEFLRKLHGESYVEILKEGGGINSTVMATREAEEEALVELAKYRADLMLAGGTTTVEIKSGYGLDYQNEKKILEVANRLKDEVSQDIVVTFLGAHTIPVEFRDRREEYLELIVSRMLPDFRHLAEFTDIFVEDGAFSPDEARVILKKAKDIGYGIKVHADQLNDLGGGGLAADFGAVSAEHLDYVSSESLKKMSQNGTVGVLLPTSTFFMRGKRRPPVELFRRYDVPMALATDHNPGTSPYYSMHSAMVFGVLYFGMTPEEAFLAATLNAAASINRGNLLGTVEVGKQADLLVLNTHSWVHLFYEPDRNPVEVVIKRGRIVYEKGHHS